MSPPTTARKALRDEHVDAVLHLLHRAGQYAHDLFFDKTAGLDITPRQLVVLQAIERDDRPSQTDLVNATGIDRSTIADIVRRMEKKGLIRRKRAANDARIYVVSLTEKSKRILRRAAPALEQTSAELLAPLNDRERDRFVDTLVRIVNNHNRSN
ncbi:MAG: MarR family transcriptional regulator [Pseudomonadota bacterium]